MLPTDAPIDYAAVDQLYVEGRHSLNSDGSVRTIAGSARTERDEAIWNDYATHLGNATWLDSFVDERDPGDRARSPASPTSCAGRVSRRASRTRSWSPGRSTRSSPPSARPATATSTPPPARRTTGTRAGRSTTAPTPTAARTPPPTAAAATSAPAPPSTTHSRRPSRRASRRSSRATPRAHRPPRPRSCDRSRSPTCRRRSATPTSSTVTASTSPSARRASTRPRAGRSTACSRRSSRRSTPQARRPSPRTTTCRPEPQKAGAGAAVQTAVESVYAGLGITADEVGTVQTAAVNRTRCRRCGGERPLPSTADARIQRTAT